MKTKVCPCCDQPISGMYCKGCKKIVLHPVEQNITYYLNTRHPEHETDCSYHGNTADPGASADSAPIFRPQKTERQVIPNQPGKPNHPFHSKRPGKQRNPVRPNHSENRGKTIRPLNVEQQQRKVLITLFSVFLTIFIIVFTIVMINVISILNGTYGGGLTGFMEREPDISYEQELTATPPDNGISGSSTITLENGVLQISLPVPEETRSASMEEWELTDAQVRERGKVCNGFGHFPVIFEDCWNLLNNCIADSGYEWGMEVFSYNQFLDEYTWYETIYGYTVYQKEMEKDADYSRYVFLDVNVDTVTGEIHGIDVYSMNRQHMFEVAEAGLKFLHKTGAAAEIPGAEQLYEEAMSQQGEYGSSLIYDLEISAYAPDPEAGSEIYQLSVYSAR